MNDNEIDRIAAMAHALRPDWPLSSLRTLLAGPELRNKPRRDMAVALAWVACENETKTPKRVVESGPWWHAANIENPERVVRRNPRPHEECHRHPGQYRVACGGCTADRKAAREAAEAQAAEVSELTRETAITEARDAVRATRAGLCGHGVKHCNECEERA